MQLRAAPSATSHPSCRTSHSHSPPGRRACCDVDCEPSRCPGRSSTPPRARHSGPRYRQSSDAGSDRAPARPDLERTPKIGGRLEGAHRTSRGSGRRNASRSTTASRCEIGTDRDWWHKGLSRHPGIGSGSEPRSAARPCPRRRLRAWARRSRYTRGDFDGRLRPDEDPFCGLSHAARFPYPAALDDAMAVSKDIIGATDPKKLAILGTSTGGGMTLAMVLRAKKEELPLPAAIAPGTPWSDMTKTGDTYFTNEMLDNV